MTTEATPLSPELEAELVRELRRCYLWENQARFANRLRPPVLQLTDSTVKLGQWHRATRTISMSRRFVIDRPWPEVMSILEHEMAHQYVDEWLKVRDEPPHGPTFAKVCAERGIDGRAAGVPEAAASPEGDRALDRIRKLFALAGSANQNEAELAMKRAHELMLRHNIDEAAARTDRTFELRHLGDPSRRRSRVECAIAGILGEFFFVEAIRIPVYLPRDGKHGHVFELSGTRPNLDMACHVYEFLLATAERLWRENRYDARVRSGRDRLAYQSGVIDGFRARLLLGRIELVGTGLVWTGDSNLEKFYRARHPRVVMLRRATSINRAHSAGREAGSKVVLHRPVEHGSTTPRLLGD